MQKLKPLAGPVVVVWWVIWGCRTMDQVRAPWFMYVVVAVISGCVGWAVQQRVNGSVG